MNEYCISIMMCVSKRDLAILKSESLQPHGLVTRKARDAIKTKREKKEQITEGEKEVENGP